MIQGLLLPKLITHLTRMHVMVSDTLTPSKLPTERQPSASFPSLARGILGSTVCLVAELRSLAAGLVVLFHITQQMSAPQQTKVI